MHFQVFKQQLTLRASIAAFWAFSAFFCAAAWKVSNNDLRRARWTAWNAGSFPSSFCTSSQLVLYVTDGLAFCNSSMNWDSTCLLCLCCGDIKTEIESSGCQELASIIFQAKETYHTSHLHERVGRIDFDEQQELTQSANHWHFAPIIGKHHKQEWAHDRSHFVV